MKKQFIFSISIILLIFSCREKKKHTQLLIIEKYTDSTYTQRIDSLQIDTISSLITGFVKIYGYGGVDSYEQGEIKQGIRTGKWYKSFYGKEITEIISYNSKGELNGECKEFFPSVDKLMSVFNYRNNRKFGEQKEYYLNGNLALSYTMAENERYVGKYLALGEKGDTLYYVDLGKEGNGYLKRYDRFGMLDREGVLVNGEYQGIVKEYYYDFGLERYEYMNIYNYYPDSISFIKRVNFK